MLKIYSNTGTLKLSVEPKDSSTQTEAIQSGSVLNISFVLPERIAFGVNDYVDFAGSRYWLTEQYRPTQKSTVEWEYSLRFYGLSNLISRFLVLNTTDGGNESVFTLTAPAREHVALIVKSINSGFETDDWHVGQVDSTDNIVIDYHGKYCDEGLKAVADAIGAEFWFDGMSVNLCRCEFGELITLGYQKGLTKIQPDVADNVKVYTRLFPAGSSRNIDPAKYGYTRLQLPGGASYVDINTDRYGIIHHYEEDAFANIFPRYTGTVSSVRSEQRINEEGNEYTVYFFKDDELPFDPNQYDLGDQVKRVTFQEGSELAGLGSDDNGTHYFEINFDSDTREFEIITQFDDTEQYPGGLLIPKPGDKYIPWNMLMPDEYYPRAENEFLEAVNEYNRRHCADISVYKVETDYLYIEEHDLDLHIGQRVRLESKDYFSETGYVDSRITKITRKVNLPSQMSIEISDALSTGALDKLKGNIDEVKAFATRSAAEFPRVIKTGDTTPASDYNVYSARRSDTQFLHRNRQDKALCNIDFDQGLTVPSARGGFSDNWFGVGARCWRRENGNTVLWVDELYARDSINTMKLRFNMVDVVSGELWQTFAYGTADRVEAGTGPVYRGGNGIAVGEGNCWIELLEDELLTFKHDDICRGIFHNIALDGSEKNNTSTDTDSCGFQQISGYTTAYFTPIALIDADGEIIGPMTDDAGNVMKDKNGIKLYDITRAKGFRYRLRQGSSFHPRKGMKIAAYGNFTDPDRQATTYATTKRLIMMEGVNTWRIDPDRNYTYIRGDLDGLEIGGMTLEGHGVMMGHAYLYGPMIKFTKEQRDELQGHDAYSVHLTQETGVITIDADGNPQALTGRYLVTTSEEGDDKFNVAVSGPKLVTVGAWILHTALQVHKAGKQLTWMEEGAPAEGSYTATLSCKGCEATIENGIIYVTAITDMSDEIGIDILVGCEGEVVIKRHYSVHLISSGDWTTYVFAHDVLDIATKAYVAPAKPTCRTPYPWEVNSVAALPSTATDEQRAAAQADDARNQQWLDGPEPYNSAGKLIYPIWYMSKAVIDGSTGKLKEGTDWSDPVKATGEDGGATDFMYARQDRANASTAPKIMKERRNPNNGLSPAIWHDTPVPGEEGSSLWMTVARIRQDGTTDTYDDGIADNAVKTGELIGTWSEPVRITGEQGEQGDNAITLDLDNEYDSILMNSDNQCVYDLIRDTDGNSLSDLYYPRTRVRFFDGTEPIELKSLSIIDINDFRVDPNYSLSGGGISEYYYYDETPGLKRDGIIHFRCNHLANPDYNPKNPGEDGGDPYGEISTYGAEGDLPMCMRVHVVATGYSGKSKKLCTGRAEWTLVRDNGSHIYRLLPEVSQIHVTSDGSFTDAKLDDDFLRCEVQRVGSDGAVVLSALPDDLLLEVSDIANGKEGNPVEVDYRHGAYLSGINNGVTDYVFRLYDKNTLDDKGNNRLLDRETVPVLRDGGRGTRGLPGLRVRLWKEIVKGQEYRNDEGIEEEVETGYVDFLAVRGSGAASGYYVYRVKPGMKYTGPVQLPATTLLSSASDLKSYLGSNVFNYWEEVDENVNTGFFNFLIANHALIDILSNTQLLIRTEHNEIVGGMQGCDRTKPVIWAGAENPEDAPVQIIAGVDDSGKPFGYALIEGKIISGKKGGQRVELNPETMAVEIFDADQNVCAKFSGDSVNINNLSDGSDMGVAQNRNTTNISGATNDTVIWRASPKNSGMITLYFDTTLNASLRGEPPSGGSNEDLFELPYVVADVEIRKLNGGVIRQETLILADNHLQENIEYSGSTERIISFRAEAGEIYSATMTVTVSSTATIKSGSKVTVACETLANSYHAEFGRNGMILSINKSNSFAVVEETEGKLVHIRNGVRQPYTVFAAWFDIGTSTIDSDVEILTGEKMISNLRVEAAGSLSFYLPDSMKNTPLIINATSLLHGGFACVYRDSNYMQVKLVKGSTLTAGEVYMEIKAM